MDRRAAAGHVRWLAAGDRAARQGHYDAARTLTARVLETAAPLPALYERLVQLNLDAGRYAAAQIYLYALADLDGWNADAARSTPARFLSTLARRRGPMRCYMRRLKTASLIRAACATLARQQIDSLEWDQAEATLGKLLALDPGDQQALYQLALLLAPVDQGYAREYLGRIVTDPAWASACGYGPRGAGCLRHGGADRCPYLPGRDAGRLGRMAVCGACAATGP